MKLIPESLLVLIIFGVLSLKVALSQTELQSGKLIPVYPGAELKTEFESGDSKMCCTFVTKDDFNKVVAFYESALKIKSLDPNGLATQLPFLKMQVDEMLKEIPAGMKISFFVLHVVEFQGRKGAELFEVATSSRGVEFDISPSQFTEKESHFEAEWNELDNERDGVSQGSDPSVAQALIPALPSSGPEGFEKGDVIIDEMTYSTVTVDFSKPDKDAGQDNFYNISVSINDYSESAEGIEDMIKPQYDNEKAIKVRARYPGKESFVKNGSDCLGYDRIFSVKNRYLVVISASNVCDMTIINHLVDKMNLDALP